MNQKYIKIINKAISDVIKKEKEMAPPGYTNAEEKFYKENNLIKRASLLQLIVKECNLERENEHIKILDVGPSEGIIPRALHNMGFNVQVLEHTGLYGGDDLIEKYDQYYQPLQVKYCVLEKGCFPYPDDSFDLVMNFGVMEHIEPPTCHFWNELNRITKRGGMIFIDNPNPLNLRKRINSVCGVNPNNEIEEWLNQQPIFTGHYREHTSEELVYSAEQSGFFVLKTGGFNFILEGYLGNATWLRKIFIYLYRLLLITDSLKDTVYIVGKKK